MTQFIMDQEQPFVCNLSAIPAEAREQHLAATPALFQAVQAAIELPNGLAFQFPNEPGRFMAVAKFVEYEHLCCPFERLTIEVEPYGGPVWLQLTGGTGYKEFLIASLRDLHEFANYIQRSPGDEDDLAAALVQLAPTMTTLMENTTS